MDRQSFHLSLFPLGLVVVVNMLGMSLLIPVLPTISEQFGGGTIMYGVLLSLYALFEFFSAPLWGSLSDKYGRKRILLLSQWGTLISWGIFGTAWFVNPSLGFLGISAPLWIIIIARVFDGITAGNAAVINAYIADISPTRKEKIKYFGLIGTMSGIGVMMGPLLGGLSAGFSSWGNFGTIISAAFLSLVTFVILWTTLPPSPHQPDKKKMISLQSLRSTVNIPRDIQNTIQRDSRMGPLWLLVGVFSLLFLGYTTVYVLHATDVLGLSIVQIGLVGTLVGLIFAINQIFVIPRIDRYFGPYHLLLFGHIMMALGLGMIAYATNARSFLACSLILVTGISWCMTLFNTIVASYTTKDSSGHILGLKESIAAAASIIAPLAGAGLYTLFSHNIFIVYAVVATAMVFVTYSQLSLDENI